MFDVMIEKGDIQPLSIVVATFLKIEQLNKVSTLEVVQFVRDERTR